MATFRVIRGGVSEEEELAVWVEGMAGAKVWKWTMLCQAREEKGGQCGLGIIDPRVCASVCSNQGSMIAWSL